MAIKFNDKKIRLWEGVAKKNGNTNIGIRFSKDSDVKEIQKIYEMVYSILELKYGKGIE